VLALGIGDGHAVNVKEEDRGHAANMRDPVTGERLKAPSPPPLAEARLAAVSLAGRWALPPTGMPQPQAVGALFLTRSTGSDDRLGEGRVALHSLVYSTTGDPQPLRLPPRS
jgi:hypothetical protein